jgi:hypothetical protein
MPNTYKNRRGGARASSTTRSSRRNRRDRSYKRHKSLRNLSGRNSSMKLSRRKGKSFRQMRVIPENSAMNTVHSSMVTMRFPRAAKVKAELKRQQQKQGESLSKQVKELKKQQKQHNKAEMNALSRLMQGL